MRRKYKTKAEAEAAQKRQRAEYRERQRAKKNTPWVKSLSAKLDAKLDDDETKPSDKAGEPFADLPPLDLPTSQPSSESSSSTESASAADGSGAPSEPEGGSTEKPPKEIFDTKQLQEMASQLAEGLTMSLGAFAAERNYFALGAPFAKLAGISAAVLVKAHATRLEISDEEAAAYVLGGIIGVNAAQAGRAYFDEKRKEKQKPKNAAEQEQPHGATNGTAGPQPVPHPDAPHVADDARSTRLATRGDFI